MSKFRGWGLTHAGSATCICISFVVKYSTWQLKGQFAKKRLIRPRGSALVVLLKPREEMWNESCTCKTRRQSISCFEYTTYSI